MSLAKEIKNNFTPEQVGVACGLEPSVFSRKSQPCPICGGKDRFYWWKPELYYCRQCDRKCGDVIDLIQGSKNMSMKEIAQACGIELKKDMSTDKYKKQDETRERNFQYIKNNIRHVVSGDKVYNYLLSRGIRIPEYTIKKDIEAGIYQIDSLDYYAFKGGSYKEKVGSFPAMVIKCFERDTTRLVGFQVTPIHNNERLEKKIVMLPDTKRTKDYWGIIQFPTLNKKEVLDNGTVKGSIGVVIGEGAETVLSFNQMLNTYTEAKDKKLLISMGGSRLKNYNPNGKVRAVGSARYDIDQHHFICVDRDKECTGLKYSMEAYSNIAKQYPHRNINVCTPFKYKDFNDISKERDHEEYENLGRQVGKFWITSVD